MTVSEYEQRRLENIARNHAVLVSLGLEKPRAAPKPREVAAVSRSSISLNERFPCRDREIATLTALVKSPANIVVTGPAACGKSEITRAVLEALDDHSLVLDGNFESVPHDRRVVIIGDDRALACTDLTGVRVPFRAYDTKQLATVLATIARRRRVPGSDSATFERFVQQIVNVAKRVTKDSRDLLKLCTSAKLFAAYATNGFQAIQTSLKRALERLHDPHLDLDHLDRVSKAKIDLPPRTALLLLACYVASFSPKQADAALFTRRKRKRANSRDAPQAVSLDRLLAMHAYMYAAHTGHKDPPVRDPALLAALASLVSLRLVASVDDVKFKCLVMSDDASSLARSLRFPLGTYLPQR